MKTEIATDVLVISPHPDDSEFGASGSIARWAREGKSIVYALCTGGEKGTNDPNISAQELAEIRKKEQLAAAKVLGVREVVFLGYEDQTLEDTSEFRRDVVRLIRTYRPERLLTSDPYRRYIWHRDHRITGQVVLDAAFPFARDHLSYPELLEEGLMPHKVKDILLWASEDPNFWVDISETFDLKMTALRCHKSQVGGHREADVEKWVRQRAVDSACDQAYDLAEAFHQAVFPL